jgi:FMN phosphatase YigB (HAD superfamily)
VKSGVLRRNFHPKLPLWSLVVFVDWHGVLSRDRFWASITDAGERPRNDPVRRRMREAIERIFENGNILDPWMRGQLSFKDVLKGLHVGLDGRFRDCFLERRLLEDCRRMKVNSDLIRILRAASSKAFIVVATDNMDCFYEQASLIRGSHRSGRNGDAHLLRDAISYFDDILCSSSVGTLKAERPTEFFGPWLDYHRLSFAQALLLDDVETNCAAFKKAGGTAIRTLKTDFDEGFIRVGPLIAQWLGQVPSDPKTGNSKQPS